VTYGQLGKKLWKVAPPGRSYIDPMTGPCVTDTVTERGVLRDGEKWQLALKPFSVKCMTNAAGERLDHMDAVLLTQFPD